MVKLINGYGITETTIYSTFKVITEKDIRQCGRSIGQRLPGTYVYVLAPDMNLCPVGVVGELYIGGLGIGLGYLRRPELTRSRFVDDPFDPGRVLYRSGDLVKWLANGDLEYVCRADTQVKVRGYRVEISEIESALTAYSAVRLSVVLAEERLGTTQLTGFFTSGVEEDLALMRSHLESIIPNYMVPSRLVQVDRIPATPNGKVDRAQLLSMGADAVGTPRRSKPTVLEEVIRKTWADVVGISSEQIGVEDSFFVIGGDSIGANLTVRMLANQGLDVELLDLFENPKLRAFADVILSKNPASESTVRAASERLGYWAEMAATRVAPPFAVESRHSAVSPRHVSKAVQAPLDDLHSVLAATEDGLTLPELLVASLSMSLRMSGVDACRILLVRCTLDDSGGTSRGATLTVAPFVLGIKDMTPGSENLAWARDALHRSERHQIAWDEAIANPAYRLALENGVVLYCRDAVAPPFELRTLPRGAMVVEYAVANGAVTVTFTVPASANNGERLQFLGEAFTLSFRESIRTLGAHPVVARKAQLSLEVQPFNDVFFRDCTLQALVAAVRYFGRDLHAVIANTTGVCVRDIERPRGLRVRVRYVEHRAIDDVLADAGLSVDAFKQTDDICEAVLECLSEGALGIVKVDCYFVEKQRTLFHRKHGDHTVLICGYNRERRTFEIIDNDAARTVQYRRTTISFDELRAAYEGYQRVFNFHGGETSYLIVSDALGRQGDQCDEANIRHTARETLRLAYEWHEEERASLDLLRDDFYELAANERLIIDHVEQLSFTLGEIILAKRLLVYQLGRVLRHPHLTQLADDARSPLEIVHGLLTKFRVSRDCSPRMLQSMRDRLGEAGLRNLDYSESVRVFLEGV